MPPNAARIAQIGNLLTSPVFAAALLGVLINLAGPLGLHLTSDPAFQQNAAILIAGLGVVLTHWYTGPVSITSTTLIPPTPVTMPAGTGVVTTGTAAVPGIAFTPLSPTAPGFGHTVQVPVEPRPSTGTDASLCGRKSLCRSRPGCLLRRNRSLRPRLRSLRDSPMDLIIVVILILLLLGGGGWGYTRYGIGGGFGIGGILLVVLVLWLLLGHGRL